MIKGSKLFTKERPSRTDEFPSIVKKWLDCEELPLRNSSNKFESLWVTMRDSSSKEGLVVGVCYRPHLITESLLTRLFHFGLEALCSQAVILVD